jgi:hypothetical protein
MNLVAEQNAFLLDFAKLINYIDNTDDGMLITGGELWRTPEQQKIYFDSGKSKTMNSNHLRRLAVDLNFIKNGIVIYDKEALQRYGDYWESLNPANRWGGNFPKWFPGSTFTDCPHFERTAI